MKIKLFTCVLFILSILFTTNSDAKSKYEFNETLEQILLNENFQGVALVSNNGKTIHQQGYGSAIKEWKVSNVPSTRFYIASLSKTFTAALIMMLVEEGKIGLDDTLASHLDDYPAEYANNVTIRQLLQHRTGIPRQFNIPGWAAGKALLPLTKSEFLSMIASMPLAFKPDASRLYSSANYFILGLVIEQLTKKSFDLVLQEKILEPLGMNESGIYQKGQLISKLAKAYKHKDGKYSFCPPVKGDYCMGGNINLNLFQASGSMYSTASDLLKWDTALHGKSLLSSVSLDMLLNPKEPVAWDVFQEQPINGKKNKVVLADGNLEGYSSLIVTFISSNRRIILLNNSGMSRDKLVDIALEIAASID
jgi:CubicO group peptidase (beta-lactamase class C family)